MNEQIYTSPFQGYDTGVQGLIQLGRNAIDRVSELERGISERDETIRQLRAQLDYAAPPITRVEQEPVAWVLFDDIFIAPKDMQDDLPNLECMKPLYAHPLAMREPTEDECREIADRFLCEVANAARGVRPGRAMFNAVREVMTK